MERHSQSKLATSVVLMVTVFFLAPDTMAAVYHSDDVPRRIPSSGTSGSIYSDLTVPDSFTITDVDVQLDITHTFDADLDVYLHHDGVEVELFTDVGGTSHDFRNTVLDDEAPISITEGTAPFSSTYRPEGSLAGFDGLNVQGLWRLRITDDYGLDSGYLNSWSIAVVPEPTTVSLLALGGVSLFHRRRSRRKM